MKNLLLLFTIVFLGSCTKPQTSVPTAGIITTFAGNGYGANTGLGGFSGDNGKATVAELSLPSDVAVDGNGNVYFADNGNNRIRKINKSGIITTIANANTPFGVTVDGSGNVYFTDDSGGNGQPPFLIRMVSSTGIVTIVAGGGTSGIINGEFATAAKLGPVYGIAVDEVGNLYISDYANGILKVNTSGIITTIAAGIGVAGAKISYSRGIAVDGSGNIYYAESNSNIVGKISSSGVVSIVAGVGTSRFSGDGGAATAAELSFPYRVSIDGNGNLYIADGGNNVIRKVNTSGIISTIAGNGYHGLIGVSPYGGYVGDGGQATSAELDFPSGIAFDASGNMYIADQENNVIRKVSK